MKRKKLVPLSVLLQDECLGDIAKYASSIYIDIKGLSSNNEIVKLSKQHKSRISDL